MGGLVAVHLLAIAVVVVGRAVLIAVGVGQWALAATAAAGALRVHRALRGRTNAFITIACLR